MDKLHHKVSASNSLLCIFGIVEDLLERTWVGHLVWAHVQGRIVVSSVVWSSQILRAFRTGNSITILMNLFQCYIHVQRLCLMLILNLQKLMTDPTDLWEWHPVNCLLTKYISRVMEWFGLEGTKYCLVLTPLPWVRTPSTSQGCPGCHPAWPWTLLRMGNPQLLWAIRKVFGLFFLARLV